MIIRPPSLATIKENSKGSFSKPVDIYSPVTDRAACTTDEKFYEVGNDINLENFNNPANQGNLSFQSDSFDKQFEKVFSVYYINICANLGFQR